MEDTRTYSHYGAGFCAFNPAGVGLSVPGTAAADTLVGKPFVVPAAFGSKLDLLGATAYITTGGTAAGPNVAVQRSLAGTGAWTTIATLNIGTAADASRKNFTLSAAYTITAGDSLRIANIAGTVASTPVIEVSLAFQEVFPG